MVNKKKLMFYEELKQIGLQELEENMSRALELATMVTYPDGRPLTGPFNLCSFCSLVDSNPEARTRCVASRTASARAAATAGKEVLHTCHAGLAHLAVPLRVAGEIVAVVLGGNVALRPLAEEAVARLARETGLDLEKLQAASGAIPIWPEERLRAAMELVRAVTDTVARLLYARQDLQRKVDELTALFEFTRTISGSLQVTEVAQQALKAVLGLTEATSGSVLMLSEAMPGVTESETAATLESDNEFRVVPTGEIVAAVEREARAAHFDSRPEGNTPEERRPAVAIPLTVGGKVTGVLTIAGRPKGARFTKDDTVFLTTLGTSLGLALENARLFRQLQARATMLERLIKVGRVISSNLDVDLVLESALANVRDMLSTQWCVLRLLDEETGELVLKASLGMSAELQAKAGRVRPDGTLLNKVLQTGKPIVVEDLTASESRLRLPYYAVEMRAVAVVPVEACGKILGTLKVYSPEPRRWSEEEIGYLATIASQTGLALENARLYSSLREYYLSAVQAPSGSLGSQGRLHEGSFRAGSEMGTGMCPRAGAWC
jgi:GAF domain-containing protein